MAAGTSGGAIVETSKVSGEDFNLFRGVFNAAVRAVASVPPEPRRTADFSLSKLLRSEGVKDAAGAVDNLMRRFLRTPLEGERRQTLIRFLEGQLGGSEMDYSRYSLEKELRELLHLIMEYPRIPIVLAREKHMAHVHSTKCKPSRRDFLLGGLFGLGFSRRRFRPSSVRLLFRWQRKQRGPGKRRTRSGSLSLLN